jgi:Arc/MetJ family transcription regulator
LEESEMRTTVTIDDDLLARAERYFGKKEKSQIVNDGIRALLHQEASRRLAKLGGSEPDLVVPPRRRSPVIRKK